MTDAWRPHARALAEARVWCAAHHDPTRPAATLRTPALAPPGYPQDWLYGAMFPDRIDALIVRRRFLLGDTTTATAAPGRILCILGDEDLAMGEGTALSRGVIDDAYFPPWDTWFACLPRARSALLLAWIPADLERDVQAAIDVAATEPIAWLTGPLPTYNPAWQSIRDLLTDARAALV
jgi:hypothetical protein